jgi:DNA-binding NarL/FixJ family response regulator
MPATIAAPMLSATHDEPRPRLVLVPGADPATGTIRVMVAGRLALLRAALRALLEREAGISVVGEAATAEAAVARARESRPDVMLLDVHLPGLDSVRAMRDVLAEPPAVVLLAQSPDDERVLAAVRAGAAGLLLEDTKPGELFRAVCAIARGATVLPPTVTRHLVIDEARPSCAVIPLPVAARRGTPPEEVSMLTPKVIEIRRGCAHGKPVGVRNGSAPTYAPAG